MSSRIGLALVILHATFACQVDKNGNDVSDIMHEMVALFDPPDYSIDQPGVLELIRVCYTPMKKWGGRESIVSMKKFASFVPSWICESLEPLLNKHRVPLEESLDPKTVKIALDCAFFQHRNSHNRTLLHTAVRIGHLGLINCLLRAGAPVYGQDEQARLLLHDLAHGDGDRHRKQQVAELVKGYGLLQAVVDNDIELVRFWVEVQHANVNFMGMPDEYERRTRCHELASVPIGPAPTVRHDEFGATIGPGVAKETIIQSIEETLKQDTANVVAKQLSWLLEQHEQRLQMLRKVANDRTLSSDQVEDRFRNILQSDIATRHEILFGKHMDTQRLEMIVKEQVSKLMEKFESDRVVGKEVVYDEPEPLLSFAGRSADGRSGSSFVWKPREYRMEEPLSGRSNSFPPHTSHFDETWSEKDDDGDDECDQDLVRRETASTECCKATITKSALESDIYNVPLGTIEEGDPVPSRIGTLSTSPSVDEEGLQPTVIESDVLPIDSNLSKTCPRVDVAHVSGRIMVRFTPHAKFAHEIAFTVHTPGCQYGLAFGPPCSKCDVRMRSILLIPDQVLHIDVGDCMDAHGLEMYVYVLRGNEPELCFGREIQLVPNKLTVVSVD